MGEYEIIIRWNFVSDQGSPVDLSKTQIDGNKGKTISYDLRLDPADEVTWGFTSTNPALTEDVGYGFRR